tara:strand:+ start:182 stop:1366 length:1185 start_codon:yes stop_codon:yes gene_type:complete
MNQEDEDFLESLQTDEDGRDGFANFANFTDETIPGVAAGIFDSITLSDGSAGRDGTIDEEDGECKPPELEPKPDPIPLQRDREAWGQAAKDIEKASKAYNKAVQNLNEQVARVNNIVKSSADSFSSAARNLAEGIISWNSAQVAKCRVKEKQKEIETLERARENIIKRAKEIGDQAREPMKELNIPPTDKGMRSALQCIRSNPFTGAQFVDPSPRCAGFKQATPQQWATFDRLRQLWANYLNVLKKLADKDREIKKAQNELRRLQAAVPNVYTREWAIGRLRRTYNRALAAYEEAVGSGNEDLQSLADDVFNEAGNYNSLIAEVPDPQVQYVDWIKATGQYQCADGTEENYDYWDEVDAGKSPARPSKIALTTGDTPSLPSLPSVYIPPVSDQC